MENPNPSQQAIAPPSITSVLKEISEDKAHVLFNNIALSSNNNDYRFAPLKEMNLNTKQYNSRISGLLKAGLIKRHKSTYSLTLLGKVVYDSQMIIGEALSHYWKLKAIETIEISSSDLPAKEIAQLISALIDNHRIKDILMKPTDVPRDEATAKNQISTPVVMQTETQSIGNQKGTDRVT
jgi:predicted transcriptional regulator